MSAINDSLGSRMSSGREFGDAIAAIARSATSTPDPRAFEDAETHLLEYLSDLLGQVKGFAYLEPLADLAESQPGGLDVMTLNYDLTVELMAQSRGLPVDRGIGSWVPGRAIERPSDDRSIRLHKLHGSLDWELDPSRGPMEPPNIISPERILETSGHEQVRRFSRRRRPWIVVGDREKLATDGPTLELLHSATIALRHATHLVVVGYSFSDAHVNALIRDWLMSDSSRTIGILDLNWPTLRGDGFSADLVRAFGHLHRDQRESRVALIEGKAVDALATVISARPAPTPTVAAESVFTVGPDFVRADVTLLGPDLHRASMHVTRMPGTDEGPRARGTSFDAYATLEELRAERDARPLLPGSYRPLSVPLWETGKTVTLFSATPPPGGELALHFRGRRVDGVDDVYGNLQLRRYEVDASDPEGV